MSDIRWDEKAGLRTGCGVRSQVIDVLKAQIKRRPAMKKTSTGVSKQSRNIFAADTDHRTAANGSNGIPRYLPVSADLSPSRP